jgi:hypothetical protein
MGVVGDFGAQVSGMRVQDEMVFRRELYFVCCSGVRVWSVGMVEVEEGWGNGVWRICGLEGSSGVEIAGTEVATALGAVGVVVSCVVAGADGVGGAVVSFAGTSGAVEAVSVRGADSVVSCLGDGSAVGGGITCWVPSMAAMVYLIVFLGSQLSVVGKLGRMDRLITALKAQRPIRRMDANFIVPAKHAKIQLPISTTVTGWIYAAKRLDR